MRKLIAYVVILLCIATVTNHPQRKYHSSEKIFWSYLRDFENKYKEFDVDLQNTMIYMGFPLGIRGILGYCHPNGSIELSYYDWEYMTLHEKEFLIFHELGHCVLNINHTFGVMGSVNYKSDTHCPTTIMHYGARNIDGDCYSKYKRFYIEGLKILKRSEMLHGE